MNTTKQTRDEAIEMVLAVALDGSRIDRYLRRADDGTFYTTDADYIPGVVRGVQIPVIEGDEDADAERQMAEALLDEVE